MGTVRNGQFPFCCCKQATRFGVLPIGLHYSPWRSSRTIFEPIYCPSRPSQTIFAPIYYPSRPSRTIFEPIYCPSRPSRTIFEPVFCPSRSSRTIFKIFWKNLRSLCLIKSWEPMLALLLFWNVVGKECRKFVWSPMKTASGCVNICVLTHPDCYRLQSVVWLQLLLKDTKLK